MAFRIHRGIFQNLNAAGTAYENAFKVDRDGVMKAVDADGTVGSAFLKVGDKASDADNLDGINSGSFLRSDASDSYSGTLTATGSGWYLWGLGTRGASAGAYGIGNRSDDSYRQMTFHVPNQAAYSSSGTIPSFGWYSNGATQLMKLNSDSGNLWLKGSSEFDGRIYADNGVHVRGDWLRVNGSNGIYFESYAGGWHMTDSSWIRAYNNKNIYTGGTIETSGVMRADNGFQVDGNTVIDGSGTVIGNINNNSTDSNYFIQAAHGQPRNNLGSPTVTEMALFNEQFNNKTAFYDPSKITVWKQTTDGAPWEDITANYGDTAIRRFIAGYDSSNNIYIPNGVYKFRIEVSAVSYVFLNALYIYWSSNSHSTKVHIYTRRVSDQVWLSHTSSSTNVSSWPGHLYLPFSTVPFLPGPHSSTGHRDIIRFEFIPNWSTGTYSDRNIDLYKMQIWGGYPAGTRFPYTVNEYGDITARRNFLGDTLYEGGTQLSSKYLGISSKAADSNLLDGIDSGSFLRSDASDSFSGILTGTSSGENLKVGGIRGTAKGSQTGEYIHLYERVHIGGPSGWGAASHGAPGQGLSTWGSVDFGMNGSGVIQLDGTTIVTAARALTNVTNTNWDAAYTKANAAPYINSSTQSRPDFNSLIPSANTTEYKEVHIIDEGSNFPSGAYTYGVVHSQKMSSMKFQWYVPHTASRGDNNTTDTIYFRTGWGDSQIYGWKYLIHSGNIAGQSVNYAASAGAVAWSNVSSKPSTFTPPLGSSTTRGGFKIGYTESGKNYPVELSDEKMFVNVPWTDTQLTDAQVRSKFSAGSNVSITNGTISATNTDTITSVGISGSETTGAITLIGGGATSITQSGGSITIRSTNTEYSAATTSAAGLMSSTDKTKLDGIATGANVTPSWVPASDPSYLTSLPSHNHDDRYYTETEINTLLANYRGKTHFTTNNGYSDYYSGGNAGWYRVAEIVLTSNCGGATLYGTLYDHRYDGADAYQISVVARSECNFTTDNESHYVNVGCTILGSTNYTNYRSKIRAVLVESATNVRRYEIQFYETAWNRDTWQLQTNGNFTIYEVPQAPRDAVGTPRVYYRSTQNADYQRANTAMYAPIYYDSADTNYYLDPASTSVLNALTVGGNAVLTTANEGSGNGIDADTVDGIHASNLFRTDGTYPNTNFDAVVEGYWHIVSGTGTTPVDFYGHRWDYDHLNNGQWAFQMFAPTSGDDDLWIRQIRNYQTQAWRKIWHTGNLNPADYAAASHNHDSRYYTETEVDTLLGTKAASSHTHGIGNITDAARWWNNFGDNHNTRTSFDAQNAALTTGFGWRYVQGNTNGPGTDSSPNQFYALTVGLGNDYNYDLYGMQLAIPRNTAKPYISVRFEENRVLGAWQKISAGYADTAGTADAVTWSNVSGKPSTFSPSAHTHTPTEVGLSSLSSNGNALAGSFTATGDITAYSDSRIKENVTTIDNALDKVISLRGVEYNKIGSEEKSLGVIAQEIREVLPEVVKEQEDGMLSVAYGNITAVLIEALKEQQKQIDELKAQIDAITK